MKDKIAATGDSDKTCETEAEAEAEAEAAGEGKLEVPEKAQVILDVRPKRPNRVSSSEEDRILSSIDARGQQSMLIQEKMLDMIKPQNVTERTAYADWAKSVMVDLHQSLWRRFQMEHSQLLERSDEVKTQSAGHQSSSGGMAPAQQYQEAPPAATSQQGQQYQTNQYQQYQAPSSSSSIWQPHPQYWPTNVQQGTSVWGSQSQEWVQAQMQQGHQLQPMNSNSQGTPKSQGTGASCQAPTTLASSATASTPKTSESSLNLSGLSFSFLNTLHESDQHVDENNNKDKEKECVRKT